MVFEFQEIIDKYKMNITGVIHAGGHFGSTIPMYQQAGIQNVIYFEPQAHAFEILSKNLASAPTYKAYNMGLAAGTGSVLLNTEQSNQGQSSSILEPKKVKDIYPHIPFIGTEAIQLATLDSFCIKNCNFLTLDVQGYENEVLKGAQDMLKNYLKYIVCEVAFSELYRGNAKIYNTDKLLLMHDFIRMDTFIHPIVESGDALYVKKEVLDQF